MENVHDGFEKLIRFYKCRRTMFLTSSIKSLEKPLNISMIVNRLAKSQGYQCVFSFRITKIQTTPRGKQCISIYVHIIPLISPTSKVSNGYPHVCFFFRHIFFYMNIRCLGKNLRIIAGMVGRNHRVTKYPYKTI